MIQPILEGDNLWRGFFLTQGETFICIQTTGLAFDPIEGRNLFKASLSNGRDIVLCQLIKLATRMSPTIGKLDWGIIAGIKNAVVSSTTVYLQDALKALQYL